ncbi:hypothetical protein ACYFX5_24665 [Bremerella sp. T1]|uniref:hypothetical protein n=1 Tax=Bremerella sp. TYQ1 TaxID=3119568 RepID=UPI001CCFA932|nr:hypothetical protein [Bremerella volcania]UBM36215.1 hypothetical protein LA756_26605 [Bremerella volcania]
MKKYYAGLFLLLATLIFFSWGSIRISSRVTDEKWLEVESTKVRDDFEQISQAYKTHDFEHVREFLHRRVRVSEGAPAAYENRFDEIIEQFDSEDVSIEHFFISETPLFYQSRDDDYVIIPTSMVVSYGFGKSRFTGFLLGHKRTSDSAWKYVDMSGNWEQPRRVIRQHFYDMPKDIPIPQGTMDYVDPEKEMTTEA